MAPGYLPIDWQLDFKSGFRWSSRLESTALPWWPMPGADIKVAWELGRMQHLPLLAGWGETTEVQRQVADFMANNPCGFGVQWCSSLEVAIRAANWAVAAERSGLCFDDELAIHGSFVRDHLEWNDGRPNNHLLVALAGLLVVADHLDHEPWLEFSRQALVEQVIEQFNEDGSHFEGSTCYHRFCAEAVAEATARLLARGWPMPDWYRERLQRMAAFIDVLTGPDGTVPCIGDNDNGRFLKLETRYEWLGLAQAQARFANLRDEQDLPEIHLQEVTLDHRPLANRLRRLAGTGPNPAASPTPGPPLPAGQVVLVVPLTGQLEGLTRVGFEHFGVWVYRASGLHLTIRCGGNRARCGHAHDDQLSLELTVDGRRLWRDPGCYVYGAWPAKRHQYRGSSAHNGPRVERAGPGELFGAVPMEGDCLIFEDHLFVGRTWSGGQAVFRSLRLEPDCLRVVDSTSGPRPLLQPEPPPAFSPGYGMVHG
ncbi:MAG: heparinase II/III family protein [Candidatus Eremiobacteraeota bacterium]|nr:heparinase II/III family protein [Candidatus Eremiobacteraeota bacterium]